MTTNKDLAIQARSKGYNIIPLRGGDPANPEYKRPALDWAKYQTQLSTIAEIRSWDTNAYGIPTGPVSKLFVLDIDTWDAVEIPEALPENKCEILTRRGRHYYFKWVPALDKKITTKTGIMPHVDVRGEGGYVVAWELKDLPNPQLLPEPPKWLIDKLPNKEQPATEVKKDDNWMIQELENITPGAGSTGRTPTFVRIINRLKKKGLRLSEIEGLIAPWAEKYSYGTDRLHKLIEDQFKRYPAPEDKTAGTQGTDLEKFLEDTEAVEWLVPGMIAKKSIVFMAGLPETMKTWLTIDLAVEMARPDGGKWLKKFPVTQGKVLFIDQERFKGETQRRFKAVLAAKCLSPKLLKGNLFVRCGTTTRLDLQHSFEAFRKELAEIQPDLVIVDSFATFHTKEENNRKDIQEVLERVKELRNEFGCTFIFIDHENKGVFHDKEDEEQPSAMRIVGSVAKVAAAETAFSVRRQDSESSFVYHTKSSLSSSVSPFMVKVVDLNPERTSISVEAF